MSDSSPAPERYVCATQNRRALVRKHATLNGIDFLEVADTVVPDTEWRQRLLFVVCLKPLPPTAWSRANVRIRGGVRVPDVGVEEAWVLANAPAGRFPPNTDAFVQGRRAGPDAARTLLVVTDRRGDFSDYDLTLRASSTDPRPPASFDPALRSVTYRFKVECPTDFDCRTEIDSSPTVVDADVDYLAKDYASFRRLMLDRMAVTAPDWKERSPADLGVALVELLAYAGDQISYFQDWVATEAYLGTARSRVSVRRHARLLDFFQHDGSNARTWVTFEVDSSQTAAIVLDAGTPVLGRVEGGSATVARASYDPSREPSVVFETMAPVTLRKEHDRLEIHTWSDDDCCLAAGATGATLVHVPGLAIRPGDFLLLEEVLNPETGEPGGADRRHRHVVRLTEVRGLDDKAPIPDPLDGRRIVEVAWHGEDALPFPLCLTRRVRSSDGTLRQASGVSVARANVVLADHGASLGTKSPPLNPPDLPASGPYRPRLVAGPITQSCRAPGARASAIASMTTDPRRALPQVVLVEVPSGERWTSPARDLLSADAFAREFVVEVETDESAFVRFGDGEHGRVPHAKLEARCRVGNGPRGNVGPEALGRVVTDAAGITRVRNPLPAVGGRAPESAERVRLVAPEAFRTQSRAVTEDDYAEAARGHEEVQDAVARFRWTGSWRTVFLWIDRRGGRPVDADFRESLLDRLESRRMAAHDLEIRGPLFIPLTIALRVCVAEGHFRSDVKAALLRVLSNRVLEDGGTGLFHPDRFTFGQPFYVSRVYQAATAVPGVQSVLVTQFHRYGSVPAGELDHGFVAAGEAEILRLDNDPNFPERGVLEIELGGGA